ncbi:COR domain-containing protein [Nonomuraea wenchangensis]|uniref:COR domain-containing protein n=1 Tax=Nonomuraea wenchangensis TaxID=568860 RepID=UPI003324ED51
MKPSEIEAAFDRAQESAELVLDDIKNISKLFSRIRRLEHLKRLSLRACQLDFIPDFIAEFRSLEVLDLADNPLKVFPEKILTLTSLKGLGLNDTRISSIPAGISQLADLSSLDLSSNALRALPISIGTLKKLTYLNLGNNSLKTLPESFADLTNLAYLYLWGNNFSKFPEELRNLPRLRVLDLSRKGSYDCARESSTSNVRGQFFPSDGVFLTRTTGLSSDGPPTNQDSRLHAVPAWLFNSLQKLEYLYLGSNKIRRLPQSINQLASLRELWIGNNDLTSVPDTLALLPHLQVVDISRNKLQSWDINFLNGDQFEYLDIRHNDLPFPPEVLDPQAPQALFAFLSRTRHEASPLNEAKLLIVGEGTVGKTSLVKRLVSDKFDSRQAKTEGIDVTRWSIDTPNRTISVNIWDFGGQEIMHATHQFFLTKRSVYVLVVDCRQGDDQNRIEYWLKLIQSFSDGSPVILVGNKADQAPLDLDRRGLMKKYRNLVSIIPASCLTGNGISEIKEQLDDVVANLPHVSDLVPTSFFAVKHYLEDLDADFLPFSDYVRLCQDNDIVEAADQETLVSFLHDLGTVLCYRDDPRLADTNILNPSWVTGGVYQLLNSHLAAQHKGIISWEHVRHILNAEVYPPNRQSFIIDMMKKFELCYESDGVLLIPDLLTKEEPDTGSWLQSLHFEVDYDILPLSLICRLIVRMNSFISMGTVWRTGMVLSMDRSRALVRADREDSVLIIDIMGVEHTRRALLGAIRAELRVIEKTIPGIRAEERVPIPEHPGIWVPYKHLLELEAAGKETVVPQGLVHDFSIRRLLAGIEDSTSPDRVQVSIKSTSTKNPQPEVQREETKPSAWSQRQAIGFGVFMVASLASIVGVTAAAYALAGGFAGTMLTLSFVAILSIGFFVLRSADRLSESNFMKGMQQILSTFRSTKKTE